MKAPLLVFVITLHACSTAATPQVASDAGDASDGAAASEGGSTEMRIDTSKLAADECSETIDCATPNTVCTDYADVSNGDAELQRPRCGPPDRCSIVTCPTGKTCFVREIYPGEVTCQ